MRKSWENCPSWDRSDDCATAREMAYLIFHHPEGFPDSSVGKESACNAGDPGLIPGLGRFAGKGIGYPLQYSWASLVTQLTNFTCSVGDLGSIAGLGRFPGERKGYPLQYSSLENSMGCIVHGVAKSRTRLSDLHPEVTFLFISFFSLCYLFIFIFTNK